ncbi:MAG: DNRLRE domain-containing protein [Chloroflexaceae bacterium]|nr:DNRLRE domain-containing protein [Chloroflexaceae bacterium]
MNEWLTDYPYHNVAVFDYFNVLTDSRNHHSWNGSAVERIVHPDSDNFSAYPSSDDDSHPNSAGDQKATAEFVPLLNVFYHRWKGNAPTPPTPSPTSEAEATPTASPTTEPTPTATTTPMPTATTPPSGEQTMVFQQGIHPEASYQGAADTTLAVDVNGDQGFADVNLGRADGLFTHHSDEQHDALLIRWDLSALPANITIQEATLELYRFDGDVSSEMQVALYRVTRGWSEGSGVNFWPADEGYVADGATWNQARPGEPWTTPGGDYDPTVLDQATVAATFDDDWLRLDATEGVQAWVEQGQSNEGFMVRALSGEGYHLYASSNATDTQAAMRPRLVLTYSLGNGGATATPTTVPPETPPSVVYLPLVASGQVVASR